MQVVQFEVIRRSATHFALKFNWQDDDTGKPAKVGFRFGATKANDPLTLPQEDFPPPAGAVIGREFTSHDILIPSEARTYFKSVPYRHDPGWVGGPWSDYTEIVWETLLVGGSAVTPPPPPVEPPGEPPVENLIVSAEVAPDKLAAIVTWADGFQAKLSMAAAPEAGGA